MSEEKDFEKMIEGIHNKIEFDEETDFSKKVIDEFRNPSNFGVIENRENKRFLRRYNENYVKD
jgi:hypothetical protein